MESKRRNRSPWLKLPDKNGKCDAPGKHLFGKSGGWGNSKTENSQTRNFSSSVLYRPPSSKTCKKPVSGQGTAAVKYSDGLLLVDQSPALIEELQQVFNKGPFLFCRVVGLRNETTFVMPPGSSPLTKNILRSERVCI